MRAAAYAHWFVVVVVVVAVVTAIVQRKCYWHRAGKYVLYMPRWDDEMLPTIALARDYDNLPQESKAPTVQALHWVRSIDARKARDRHHNYTICASLLT